MAALVDLGVPFEAVESAVSAIGIPGTVVRIEPAMAGSIGGSRFLVEFDPRQPERAYSAVVHLLDRAWLPEPVRDLAKRIFARLASAEARVHRVRTEDVHFHEVGAVDSITDIVGAAACFAYLGARVVGSPLPMGRGFADTRHGRIPLPGPATVECLRGVPTEDAGVDGELVTPTGAAIFATVVDRFARWPSFAPARTGWGCGARSLPDRPNALRAIVGDALAVDGGTHVVLEANVDDMTGELVGHAIAELIAAGALDAWATPITMKKGRPALTIHALADAGRAEEIERKMLAETTTLGLRRHEVGRTERPRRAARVPTRFGEIPVKIGGGPWGPPRAKPEFDACARAARDHGVSVQEVIAEALRAWGAQSGRSSE